jgi:hypothetical protein
MIRDEVYSFVVFRNLVLQMLKNFLGYHLPLQGMK